MENDNRKNHSFSVSQFVALLNQTLDYTFPDVVIQGEVSGLRISQGKWVRFKLKDEQSAVDFFGSVYQMKIPLEDGMVVAVQGRPRLSDKYGFSVSFQAIQPVGAGTIKRSFEILKEKLSVEGLFAPERKRILPALPRHIGVISSTQAAGYIDFLTILNARYGGMKVDVAHTLVQGVRAPGQIVRAIKYFESLEQPPEIIVIVRGGGDPDDLAAFNDEELVRTVAGCSIPTLVGVGHEIDITLCDLAADVRAATPSNAAQLLVPDRRELIEAAHTTVRKIVPIYERTIDEYLNEVNAIVFDAHDETENRITQYKNEAQSLGRLINQYDPATVLRRGYALVRGNAQQGAIIEIERFDDIITAEVQHVKERHIN